MNTTTVTIIRNDHRSEFTKKFCGTFSILSAMWFSYRLRLALFDEFPDWIIETETEELLRYSAVSGDVKLVYESRFE